jgi:hypothetical protein
MTRNRAKHGESPFALETFCLTGNLTAGFGRQCICIHSKIGDKDPDIYKVSDSKQQPSCSWILQHMNKSNITLISLIGNKSMVTNLIQTDRGFGPPRRHHQQEGGRDLTWNNLLRTPGTSRLFFIPASLQLFS